MYFTAARYRELQSPPLRARRPDAHRRPSARVRHLQPVPQARRRARRRTRSRCSPRNPTTRSTKRFQWDRSELPWPATDAEISEVWRKNVKSDGLRLMLTGKTWTEAAETLKERYERSYKRITQLTTDDVFEMYMNAVAHNMDPHSSYLSPRQSEEYRIQMSLSYDGIGASLQLEDDYVKVMNIIPGGPAQIDGQLKPEDRITAVGEGSGELVDVIGWRLDDVVQKIRGPGGTRVRLQVLPAGAAPGSPEKIIELTRDKIKLEEQAAKKELLRDSVRRRDLPHRRHHRAELLSGLRRAQPRRRGLHEHVARRHAPHRGVQSRGRHRRPRHGSARQRRRTPVGSHGADRPVHRARPDRAAARDARHDPTARRSEPDGGLRRSVGGARSIATAPAPRRSSPRRFRTTTAASSSASRRSARAPCRICSRSTASCAARTTASSR